MKIPLSTLWDVAVKILVILFIIGIVSGCTAPSPGVTLTSSPEVTISIKNTDTPQVTEVPTIIVDLIDNTPTVVICTSDTCTDTQPTPEVTAETTSVVDDLRVDLATAKTAYDQKTAIFVDVRGASSYAAKHIAGAINIPVDQIEERSKELDPNQWIITYCT